MQPSDRPRFKAVLALALSALLGLACERPAHAAAGDLPKPATDLPAPKDKDKPAAEATVVLAGGCFWCTEAVFEKVEGVRDVVSGYAGGTKETANYKAVLNGDTGHAEAIKITYDPAKLTYGEILRIFFTTHDPTTKDRQGNDRGPQYRSAIFYATDDEKKVAEAYIKQLDAAKAFDAPIVTTLEPLKAFYVAEEYHQNYARQNPNQPYIRGVATPKVNKLFERFQDKIKKDEQPKK